MDDVIEVQDRFYILATHARLDDRKRVLKHGDTFAVFNREGDISDLGDSEQGIYHRGTRFPSRLDLRLADHHPLLLSSMVGDGNTEIAVDLTNPDEYTDGHLVLERGVLHLLRTKLVWEA